MKFHFGFLPLILAQPGPPPSAQVLPVEIDISGVLPQGPTAVPNILATQSLKKPQPPDIFRATFPNCPMECTPEMKDDEWCNTECYLPECGNDAGDCDGWCAPDCKPGWVGDGWCDKDCFRVECQWDGKDCDSSLTRNH